MVTMSLRSSATQSAYSVPKVLTGYNRFGADADVSCRSLQLVAGLVGLGGLIAFVSHSVIVGFTAAAAVLINGHETIRASVERT